MAELLLEEGDKYFDSFMCKWNTCAEDRRGLQGMVARHEEIARNSSEESYKKLILSGCWGRTCKKPVGLNKGGTRNPVYRSRLVAMDTKPPHINKRGLCARCGAPTTCRLTNAPPLLAQRAAARRRLTSGGATV